MRTLRKPVVAGLAPAAGTSTLAAALHATDGGVLAAGTAGEADLLVCRAEEPSLRQAAALACPPSGPRPVLVLVGPPLGTPPLPAGRFAAVLGLPRVHSWAGRDALREAAAALAYPPERLPPDVRRYAAALHHVVAALVGSGQLRRATPPSVSRPAVTALWRGLRPVAGPAAVGTVRRAPVASCHRSAEPDDDALEAERGPVPAGRVG